MDTVPPCGVSHCMAHKPSTAGAVAGNSGDCARHHAAPKPSSAAVAAVAPSNRRRLSGSAVGSELEWLWWGMVMALYHATNRAGPPHHRAADVRAHRHAWRHADHRNRISVDARPRTHEIRHRGPAHLGRQQTHPESQSPTGPQTAHACQSGLFRLISHHHKTIADKCLIAAWRFHARPPRQYVVEIPPAFPSTSTPDRAVLGALQAVSPRKKRQCSLQRRPPRGRCRAKRSAVPSPFA